MFDSPPAIHHLTDWSTNTMIMFIAITALVLVVMAGSFFIAEIFDFDTVPVVVAGLVNLVAIFVVYWLHGEILRRIVSDQLVSTICAVGLVLGLIVVAWAYFSHSDHGWVAFPFIALAIASLGNGIEEWLTRIASSIPISVGGLVALVVVGALFLVVYITSER